MNNNVLTIYTDGGSRGNPGLAASAFIVYNQEGKEVFKKALFLGMASNNVAEYSAVWGALKWCLAAKKTNKLKFNYLNFYLDSLLVVNQLRGIYKIKNLELGKIVLKIKTLERQLESKINFEHIPREENKKADRLVNQMLDQQFSS